MLLSAIEKHKKPFWFFSPKKKTEEFFDRFLFMAG